MKQNILITFNPKNNFVSRRESRSKQLHKFFLNETRCNYEASDLDRNFVARLEIKTAVLVLFKKHFSFLCENRLLPSTRSNIFEAQLVKRVVKLVHPYWSTTQKEKFKAVIFNQKPGIYSRHRELKLKNKLKYVHCNLKKRSIDIVKVEP